jgi:Protein of unknown function (DUF1572)
MTADLSQLFRRDLEKTMRELEAYPNEASLWAVAPGITNSAGNLALHIVGNLNQYIGVDLGSTNFVRNREAEFASRDVPRSELIAQLEGTITTIESVLSTLEAAQLEMIFPKEMWGRRITTGFFLLHLYGHLNYHLGQINYHRRLVAA